MNGTKVKKIHQQNLFKFINLFSIIFLKEFNSTSQSQQPHHRLQYDNQATSPHEMDTVLFP